MCLIIPFWSRNLEYPVKIIDKLNNLTCIGESKIRLLWAYSLDPLLWSCWDKHLTLTSSINQKSAVRILSYAQRREHAIVYQPVHINTTIIIYSQVFTKYEK